MLNRKCPRADELSDLVEGRTRSRRLQKHVANCAICTQIVANLRRDAELLQDLQAAVKSPPDDAVREDLMDACRSASRVPSSS